MQILLKIERLTWISLLLSNQEHKEIGFDKFIRLAGLSADTGYLGKKK